MTHVPHPCGAGYVVRQPIYSRDPLIAWSHRRRLRTALALARPFTGGRVLDYGCGDGTFLDCPGTSSYTLRDLATSVFAASTQHIGRPVFHRADGTVFHDHEGFNWRVLRTLVAARFGLARTLISPFSWTGTQGWFVARRRAARRSR